MLYIVGTPIGNLKDVTQRAIETLHAVSVVIMESPADSKKLLSALGITGKIIRKFNDQNAKKALHPLVQEIRNIDAAYITSAGMPAISDPGAMLVHEAREQGIGVQVIPGPSAVTAALAGSGFMAREFTFAGFLPRKAGQIGKLFKKHAEMESTLVFFESPFRIKKSIEILDKTDPGACVCASKELTKMFENYFIGTPASVLDMLAYGKNNTKGEFTVVVDFKNTCSKNQT